MSTPDQWTWLPHAAHLCVGNYCRFHIATEVGGYIVSTVGEYVPDSIMHKIRGKDRTGFEDIGWGRKYQTMVFKSQVVTQPTCCPFRQDEGGELDMVGYNDPAEAMAGHMRLCRKWAKKEAAAEQP